MDIINDFCSLYIITFQTNVVFYMNMLLHFDSFFVKVFILADDVIIKDTSVIVGDTAILHYVLNNTLT